MRTKRILYIFIALSLFVHTKAFTQTIESTNTGTISMVINDIDVPGQASVNYLSVGGTVFAQGNKWFSLDEPGYRLLYVYRPGSGWYDGVNVYYVGESDGVQDMLSIAFTGESINVYANGVLAPHLYSEPFNPVLSGLIDFDENLVASKVSFTPQVVGADEALSLFNSYKNHGNFGDTIIDKFFNIFFSLF